MKKQYIRPTVMNLSFANLLDHGVIVPSVTSVDGRAAAKKQELEIEDEEDDEEEDEALGFKFMKSPFKK